MTEEMLEIKQITVAQADWDNLVAHRNNLEQVAQARLVENERLLKLVEQQRVAAETLEQRLKNIESTLGLSALENRITELENKADHGLDEDLIDERIEHYMDNNFDVEDHLSNVYDWDRYIDCVTKDDLSYAIQSWVEDSNLVGKEDVASVVRDVVNDLTFEVTVS